MGHVLLLRIQPNLTVKRGFFLKSMTFSEQLRAAFIRKEEICASLVYVCKALG